MIVRVKPWLKNRLYTSDFNNVLAERDMLRIIIYFLFKVNEPAMWGNPILSEN